MSRADVAPDLPATEAPKTRHAPCAHVTDHFGQRLAGPMGVKVMMSACASKGPHGPGHKIRTSQCRCIVPAHPGYSPAFCVSMGTNPWERAGTSHPWHECKVQSTRSPACFLSVLPPSSRIGGLYSLATTALPTECSIEYSTGLLPIFHTVSSDRMPSHIRHVSQPPSSI